MKVAIEAVDSEVTFIERENRFELQSTNGILNIIKRDYVLNYTLAAEWIHYCLRINPMVPKLLQILLPWLKKSNSEMDEEIFIHFVLFYLVHSKHIPSLEAVMGVGNTSGDVVIPPPSETKFFINSQTAPSK